MKSQVGARYLFKCKTRKDESFQGIIKITNRVKSCIRLSSGAVKQKRIAAIAA